MKEKKKTKKHPVPAPECSCKAIIIKHPCICVQIIPQLLALILYTQRKPGLTQGLRYRLRDCDLLILGRYL